MVPAAMGHVPYFDAGWRCSLAYWSSVISGEHGRSLDVTGTKTAFTLSFKEKALWDEVDRRWVTIMGYKCVRVTGRSPDTSMM